MIVLAVHHILGVRPDESGLLLRPRLLPGLDRVRAEFPFRGRRVSAGVPRRSADRADRSPARRPLVEKPRRVEVHSGAVMENRRTVLFVSTAAAFLTPFMGSSLNIALPTIGREFSMTAVALGWVATSYLLAAAIGLVPFGRIADMTGRAAIFTWGSLVYAMSSVLSTVAGSAAFLLVTRALQGLGGAMVMSTGVAILTAAYPAERPGPRPRHQCLLDLSRALPRTRPGRLPDPEPGLAEHLLAQRPLRPGGLRPGHDPAREDENHEPAQESFDIPGAILLAVWP